MLLLFRKEVSSFANVPLVGCFFYEIMFLYPSGKSSRCSFFHRRVLSKNLQMGWSSFLCLSDFEGSRLRPYEAFLMNLHALSLNDTYNRGPFLYLGFEWHVRLQRRLINAKYQHLLQNITFWNLDKNKNDRFKRHRKGTKITFFCLQVFYWNHRWKSLLVLGKKWLLLFLFVSRAKLQPFVMGILALPRYSTSRLHCIPTFHGNMKYAVVGHQIHLLSSPKATSSRSGHFSSSRSNKPKSQTKFITLLASLRKLDY